MKFVPALAISLALAAAAPVSAAHDAVYDPPAGTYPFFPHSPFLRKMPRHPRIDPLTQQWLDHMGGAAFGHFQFADAPDAVSEDYYTPIYVNDADAEQPVSARIHCTAPWGRCPAEGVDVALDLRDLPEDGGDPSKDSHMAIIDRANDREIDLWQAHWPPQNGVLEASWGGVCSLDGDGKRACESTGSHTPLSIGIIRVDDLFAALDDDRGLLPYALSVSVKCTNGFTPSVTASDGHTPGCPPEGVRLFLDMDDEQVDATQTPPIMKVVLRTIDREHYGAIVTDRNGGQNEIGFGVESDATYQAAGRPGPLVTRFIPEVRREGFYSGPFRGVYHLSMPVDGIDLTSAIKFVAVERITF